MTLSPDQLEAHRRRWFHNTIADRHIARGMKPKRPPPQPKLPTPEVSDDRQPES